MEHAPPSATSDTLDDFSWPTAEFRQSVAVIIGINDYTNGIPRLTTPTHDAERLAALLQTDHHYTVQCLTETVTKQRLADLFQHQLPTTLGADDRLLVYFAGHGIALDGDDGPTGYLIPQDGTAEDRATFLPMTELQSWLNALPCRHLLLILDCCFAGAFRWASTRNLTLVPEVIHQERYDRFIQSPAWQVLTSAAYDQTALDLLAGDVKRGVAANTADCHSPFANALFQALAGASDLAPQGHGDGVITATELYLYLRDAVEVRADQEANHQQTPGLWPLKKHRKGEYIFLTPGQPLKLPAAPDLTAQNNPYRGLKPYEQQHAKLFFGREQQIAELVTAVTAQPLTVVLGASGTGKSSLVKAGLLPALQSTTTGAPDEAEWHVLEPLRPGDAPLHALAHLLTTNLGAPTVATGPATATPPPAPSDLVGPWLAAHPRQRLVLVIDQFEELITQCRDDAERRQFQQQLATALATYPQQVRVVLTLRSDFEPQFTASPLVADWQASRYIVPPLTQADLRAVIEGPAAASVLYFEPPELVDRLIDEVIQTPGALPLLSFTLSEMYMLYVRSVSDNRALTQEHYAALGGVIGSLRTRATQEYTELPDDAHRATMQRIMLRMVSVEGGELARRRVPLFELTYPDAVENTRVTAVINRLVEARLLVRDSGDLDEDGATDSYVEPAHDALVRAWDQLLGWQRAAALYLPLQRRLTQAARAWKNAPGTDKLGLLWNDDPGLPQVLPQILQQVDTLDGLLEPLQALWPPLHATGLPDWLNEVETAFIQQSVRRRALLRRRIVGLALAVIVALSATALVALVQRQNAITQRNNFASTALAANAQLAIQNGDYDLAIALALQATQADDPPTLAQNTLAAAAYVPGTELYYQAHTKAVTGVALSPNGHYAVSAALDQSAVIWDLQTHTITHRLDASQIVSVTAVAYSPTQEQVLLGLGNGELVVWDVVSGAVQQRLRVTTRPITALTYNPTGEQAFVGDQSGALALWELTKGTPLLHLAGHKAAIRAVAISADGASALSGGDMAKSDQDAPLFLWDLTTGQRRQSFAGHRGSVILVAFGPLPGYIISGSQDYYVMAWKIATGKIEGRFQIDAHTQHIGSIAVAPGYATVASGGWDGGVALWGNPARGGLIRAFVGHRAPVVALAYSQDGQRLLSGSKDGVVRLWDISGPAQIRRLMLEPILSGQGINPVHNLAVDTERQRGLSGTVKNAILWDLKTGTALQRFPASPNKLSSVALSPDGQAALTGADGDLHWWELTTGAEKAALPGHTHQIITILYSTDSQHAWSADEAGLIIGWDLAHQQQQWSCTLAASNLWSIAISPDGQFALSGAEDASVVLWELPTCQAIRHFVGHQDAVYWVALSPDQTTALTGSADRSIILWDLATGKPIRDFTGHTLPVHTVAYSPDGQTILSGSEDKTIRLWDLQTGAERFRFEGHPTTVQNVLYLPGTDHLLSRAKDGSLIEWRLPLSNLAALRTWTYAHRYVRDLTCDEKLRYNLGRCP